MMSSSNNVSSIARLQTDMASKKAELAEIAAELSKLNSRKRRVEKEMKSLKEELEFLNGNQSNHSNLDRDDFPWSSDAVAKLKLIFKIDSFRSHQKAAINATMSKIDCILIMPTGGGKSLCFQLPAILSTGITLVISPLLALMEDQLQGLQALKIPAAQLNSQTHKDESKRIMQAMIDPKAPLKLLYVTPERLAKSKRFMSQLEKMHKLGRLSRLVIDEVHCCSSWGHDFRPDYKFLGIMKRQFPGIPIIGLTATATAKVTLDIQKMLNLEGCLIFKDSFFRSNLKYEVYDALPTKDRVEEIADLVKSRFPNDSGIIYCLTISDVENVTTKLQSLGMSCDRYHASLEPHERARIQSQWYHNKIHVIVATVAFGLGINKLDVRYVLHYSISKSLESFYQESGRGGRDGKEAYCILFYQLPDVFRATSMMMAEKNGVQNVYIMLQYCLDRQTCRKELIAQHFGDDWNKDSCAGMCDNCEAKAKSLSRVQTINVTAMLRDILKLLDHGENTEQRVTVLKLMNAWFSKGEKKLRLDEVKVPHHSRTLCESVVARLLLDRYIEEQFHFTPYAAISHLVRGPQKHAEGTVLNYTFPNVPSPCSVSNTKRVSLPVKVKERASTYTANTIKTSDKLNTSSSHSHSSKTFSSGKMKSKPVTLESNVAHREVDGDDEDLNVSFGDTPINGLKTSKKFTFKAKSTPPQATPGPVAKKRKFVVDSSCSEEEDDIVILD